MTKNELAEVEKIGSYIVKHVVTEFPKDKMVMLGISLFGVANSLLIDRDKQALIACIETSINTLKSDKKSVIDVLKDGIRAGLKRDSK